MKKTARLIMPLVFLFCTVSSGEARTNDLRQVAVDYAIAEYGAQAKGMEETSSKEQKGLVVTVEKPDSQEKAMYWVMFEEVTPVSAGKPQPENKWKRLNVLGIMGPKYGGWAYTWSRPLSDDEFQGLSRLKSPKTVSVEEKIVQAVIKDKILPENARAWHQGQFFARATRAKAFTFGFNTKVSMGGNLMGITVYVDTDGTVITKSESMLHVD